MSKTSRCLAACATSGRGSRRPPPTADQAALHGEREGFAAPGRGHRVRSSCLRRPRLLSASVRRAAQLRRDSRRLKRDAHARGSDALERLRIGSRAARAVAPGRLLRFPFRGAMPLRGRALVLRTEPRQAGSRPFGLRSLSRAPRRPLAASQGARLRSRRGAAWARWVTARKRRRRTRKRPVTGPCRPARRSPGAVDRRPRRAH